MAKQILYVGPPCFCPLIRVEEMPKGLKLPGSLKQYNRIEEPITWMQDLFNAIEFDRGSSDCAVRYLPMYLTRPTRQWIHDLLEKSIHKCLDMYTTFTTNLEGTYKRPHTSGDLQRCQQQKDKSSRDFMSKWLEMKKSCEGIKDET
jgi:hypothetical protein